MSTFNRINNSLKQLLVWVFLFSLIGAKGQDNHYVDSLSNLITTTTHDSSLVEIYIDLGDSFENTFPDSSLYFYQRAYQIAYHKGLINQLATCQRNIANIYIKKSRYDTAEIISQQSLENYKKTDYKIGVAEIYDRLAYIKYSKGEYVEAIELFNKAKQINKEVKNYMGLANNLSNIGLVYTAQSELKKAADYYQKAIKINKAQNHKENLASNYGNIALIYINLQQLDLAWKYHEKSLNLFKEQKNQYGIASNYMNMGGIAYYEGKFDLSLKYYLKALKINEELDRKHQMALSIGNIGVIYKQLGNYSKAIEYYKKSIKINHEIGREDQVAFTLINLSGLYNSIEKYDESVYYAEKAFEISKVIDNPKNLIEIYQLLSDAYKGLRLYQKALQYSDLSRAIKDSVYSIENNKAVEEIQAQYEAKEQQEQIKRQQAEIENEKTKRRLTSYLLVLLVVVVIVGVWAYYQKRKSNNLLKTQKDKLEHQKKQVDDINREISNSIDYATKLQQSVLPTNQILEQKLSDFFVLLKPRDIVSGDFYWWTHIEGHTIITAADSTGHGVPGAFMSMLGMSILRDVVEKEYITHTGVILRRMRKGIITTLKQQGEIGEQKDGMDMAIISIKHDENRVQYSGANNPLYIITKDQRAIPNHKPLPDMEGFYEIKPDKMPIAIYDRMDKFTSHEFELQKGDKLYMFSDGFADQFGGEKGKKLKYKAFKHLIYDNSDKPMTEQKDILNKAFIDWKGNLDQIDDVIVLGVEL